jgi:signal transduction histidine kinase
LDAELNVADANNAFAAMVGRDLKEVLGLSLSAILPHQVLDIARVFINDGEPTQASRLNVEVSNHIRRYWDLSLWAMGRNEDKFAKVILQVIDRTETVLLEQQREDFVASVAHDIKNPLLGAGRIFDSLCRQLKDTLSEQQLHALSTLRDSNENLISLVQNLVDIYRYETVTYPCQYEAVDFKTLIAECINQIANLAGSHNVSVLSKVPDSLPPIKADVTGMRRVLMNLLHNAVKFNKEGGTVAVAVANDSDTFYLSVTDTGVGISESDQLAIFQRFGQGSAGKRFANGTGLGLYLAKQIVEAHLGKITCESEAGEGSKFIVSLPVTRTLLLN